MTNQPAVTAKSQKGSVLIIVLWTSVLLTVLVTAMAGKVRLSAQTVAHNQDVSRHWAAVMGTVHQAEMELMLEMMAPPIDQEVELTEEGEARNPRYRFNGQPLTLHYPQAEEMVVRIYDHAGKINLNRIPRRNMQMLIEKRLGGLDADPEQVQDLLSAWTDWTDLNNLEDSMAPKRITTSPWSSATLRATIPSWIPWKRSCTSGALPSCWKGSIWRLRSPFTATTAP